MAAPPSCDNCERLYRVAPLAPVSFMVKSESGKHPLPARYCPSSLGDGGLALYRDIGSVNNADPVIDLTANSFSHYWEDYLLERGVKKRT